MAKQIALRLSDSELEALDDVVQKGGFASRTAAMKAGLERLAREQREREIEEAYRRGYGRHPQEEWVGEVGLALLAELDHAERGEPL